MEATAEIIAEREAKSAAAKAAQSAARKAANAPATPEAKAPAKAKARGKAKAVAATTATPPARTNKAGAPVRCQVIIRKTGAQCENPARHDHGRGWTCTTHHLSALRGRALFTGKVAAATTVYVSPTQQARAAEAAAAKRAK